MSPLQAMERSYSVVKHMLREGKFQPGFRLEANRLADELGVSMTPVRDVLHRLVGERLVEASSGDGFHVPRFTEAMLRDLYEWNSALAIMAARTSKARDSGEAMPLDPSVGPADRVAMFFESLAADAPNHEIRAAVVCANDRLHAFRLIEKKVLNPVVGELEALAVPDAGQPATIRRYHVRRMKVVPALLRMREGH